MSDFDTLAGAFAPDFVAHMGDEVVVFPAVGQSKQYDAIIGLLRQVRAEYLSGNELREELREECYVSLNTSDAIQRKGKVEIAKYAGEKFTIGNVDSDVGLVRLTVWRAAVMSIGRRNTEFPNDG